MGLPFIYPDAKLRYVGNFLHMMFSMPYEPHMADPDIEAALNMILILHADHEQNCSTSTVRVVGSSGANLFASCAAGVCALWGPLHGGANVAVLDMLDDIHKGGLSPEKCIEMAKDKKSSFRLMGFGHRVYKNFDPRAKILKASADKILAKMKIKDPLLDIAQKLEELALKDPVFRRAQAVSQRRFLQRHSDEGDGHPGEHVHGDVRHRPPARLDRPLAGTEQAGVQNRPAPADLYRVDEDSISCRWKRFSGTSVISSLGTAIGAVPVTTQTRRKSAGCVVGIGYLGGTGVDGAVCQSAFSGAITRQCGYCCRQSAHISFTALIGRRNPVGVWLLVVLAVMPLMNWPRREL
jgi:hypothetical protein